MSAVVPSPVTRRNAVVCLSLIAAFVLALTLHGYLSRPTLDRYGDMYENYAWGALWQWGYFKHPPFFGWETAAWFLVFPRTDFWYFLLAGVNAGAALLALWRIAARFGGTGFQVMVLTFAMLMPPVSFLGLNFNANAAMTPLWAALFLFYLRGLEQKKLLDAALIGVFAAFSMLTKYHSAVMLGALLIHALTDREARSLLFSTFGLVAAAVFLAVMAPHFYWLYQNDFLPITYAAHQDDGVGANLYDMFRFVISPIGYCALAILVARCMRDFRDPYPVLPLSEVKGLRRSVTGRALIAFAVWPMVLTVVLGYAANAELSAVWGIPFHTPYAVIIALLVPAAYYEIRMKRAIGAAALFMAIIIGIAPIWYRFELKKDVAYYNAPLSQLAEEVDRRWAAAGGSKRPLIFGEYALANPVSFYSRFDPLTLEDDSFEISKNYVTLESAKKRGMIGLCLEPNGGCNAVVKAAIPATVGSETFSLPGHQPGVTWTYRIWLLPPQP